MRATGDWSDSGAALQAAEDHTGRGREACSTSPRVSEAAGHRPLSRVGRRSLVGLAAAPAGRYNPARSRRGSELLWGLAQGEALLCLSGGYRPAKKGGDLPCTAEHAWLARPSFW